jgi:DNA modification methylase
VTVDIRIGDCRQLLAAMPDESVHCVVTSPPYWGLRDYGVDGQLGMERTLGEHIDTMVDVFREVRRVLRKDGTLWLNYGDCYATSPNGRSASDTKAAGNDDRTFRDKPFSTIGPIQARSNGGEGQHLDRRGGVLKPKDLCMIPNRLAIALQDDGWWVRSEIIWHKPNPMPESIKDRPTTAHEKVWLLSRSERYFYDHKAVRQPRVSSGEVGVSGWATGDTPHDAISHSRDKGNAKTFRGGQYVGGNKFQNSHATERTSAGNEAPPSDDRSLRNVWTIATAGYGEAHFATFPPDLIEPCIKAGCPKGGTVLDPFGGAGTTGLVADRLGRNAILLELNPTYAEMARRRISNDAGMFAEVAAQ